MIKLAKLTLLVCLGVLFNSASFAAVVTASTITPAATALSTGHVPAVDFPLKSPPLSAAPTVKPPMTPAAKPAPETAPAPAREVEHEVMHEDSHPQYPEVNQTRNSSLAPMLQRVLAAIVNIRADIKITDLSVLYQLQKQHVDLNNGPLPDSVLSVASGVIVNAEKGYIITNAHVVNDAQTIVVTLNDGSHYTAKLIGLDKASDVALIQIKAKNLTSMPLGDSSNLKVGDAVAAIGNPFGLNQTVTSGIISALGRSSLGIENIENFIQTDAPINPGNSGGALINMRGELIGINTAILGADRGSIGIGFAVPVAIVRTVMMQLIQFGDVKRGVLGIGVQDITPELAKAYNILGSSPTQGAVVTLTQKGSPAQTAGLIVGDVIKSVNNIPIKNANDIVSTVGFLRVESKITISIARENKNMTLNAVLSDSKKLREVASASDPFFYGVGMQNFFLLSPIHGEINGIMVVSVDPDSHAWQADLRPGDVIIAVDQERVSNITEMKSITNNTNPSIVLNVLRGAGAIFLVINREDS
jgi:serine protease Do